MLTFVKSVAFLLVLIGVSLFYSYKINFLRLINWFSPSDRFQDRIHSIATDWGHRMVALIPGWEISIVGNEYLPESDKPMVIVANHQSATDIFAMYFLRIQFRWLAKDSLFRFPIFGSAMKAAGYIPITRGSRKSHHDALEESAKRVRSGYSMLFFPEGTRSITGEPKEFKIGAFKVAAECGVPILPVVLHGAGNLLKKGTLCPNPSHLKIKILPSTTIGEKETIADFAHRVENLIRSEYKAMS
jgi:1-acyl-sn-glycerol-3-phosphate acyltransferase